MKAFFATLLITSSAFAGQLPAAISFGGGDVASAAIEKGEGLSIKKKDGTLLSLSCRGGLFSKNTMVLELNGETVASGKVQKCENSLYSIYNWIFVNPEIEARTTLGFSDAPNAKGLYDMTVSFSRRVEVVK